MPNTTNSKAVSAREPFTTLHNQGMILGPDGQKMSKSKGNIVNPDDVIKEYGADCLRMYEMFMGPYADNKPWGTSGIKGVYRFLVKVWGLINDVSKNSTKNGSNENLQVALNDLVKNIDDKIEKLQFNTCVSDFMKFLNENSDFIYKNDLKIFLKLLFPFAPVIVCEGLESLGEPDFLDKYYNYEIVWPVFDPHKVGIKKFKIKVMIANKYRGDLENDGNQTQAELVEMIQNDPNLNKFLPQKVTKIIYVPNKVLNII